MCKTKAETMKKVMTLNEFMKQYSTEETCMKYLVQQKWSKGFRCSRCGHEHSIKGRKWYYRRCKACLYDEVGHGEYPFS
ncbi:MAG: hypothetical protein RL226_1098 [Bacteroidota bacterium]